MITMNLILGIFGAVMIVTGFVYFLRSNHTMTAINISFADILAAY